MLGVVNVKKKKLYSKLESLLAGVNLTVELKWTVKLVFALSIKEYQERLVGSESR